MGAVIIPRVVRYELCSRCGCLLWRCRVRGGDTLAFHPNRVSGGSFDVLPNGSLRGGFPEKDLPRYQPHAWGLCPVLRRWSTERRLREAVEDEIKAALEEGRRPPPPKQLSLLPDPPPPRWRRSKDGWVDLTSEDNLPLNRRPRNLVVVVDLTGPSQPPRPN